MTTFTTEDRVQAQRKPKIAVITPTTGIDLLTRAVNSVISQTMPAEHWVVADGVEASRSNPSFNSTSKRIVLPENTGRHNGVPWNGHRIYAGVSFLVNADYVLFLDEDNWFADNHVESMVKYIEDNKLDWCYSLRKIYNQEGKFECVDDCESLGKYPTFYDHTLNFVDTNCYCVKGDLLPYVSPHFYMPAMGDRPFYKALAQTFPKFGCTGEYTVNYTARPELVDMFKDGNKVMDKAYGELPWRKK